jgi:hypothetical protein
VSHQLPPYEAYETGIALRMDYADNRRIRAALNAALGIAPRQWLRMEAGGTDQMAREAIFIGYRRDDTADVAGRMYDALATRFGRARIFKDVDNLRPGADFGAYIQTVLPGCRVALILIGPSWLEASDEDGRRRLDDAHDWVRIEIETALATPGLDVVPVLVNGARMPRAGDLPPSLHPLLRRHAAIIRRDPDFHDDVARLVSALRSSVQTGKLDLAYLGADRKATAETPPPRRSSLRGWALPAGAVATALLAVLVWWPWRNTTPPVEPAPIVSGKSGNDIDADLPVPDGFYLVNEEGTQFLLTESVQLPSAAANTAPLSVRRRPVLRIGSVERARVVTENGTPNVEIQLTQDGGNQMYRFTREYVNRRLAVVINGVVVSDPVITEPIQGTLQVSGVTEPQANAIVRRINRQANHE